MKPTFKVKNSDRFYVTPDYVTNGHWLIKKDMIRKNYQAPKPLTYVLDYKPGTYHEGFAKGMTSEKIMEIDHVIPKRDGYLLLTRNPVGCEFSDDTIKAYIFESEELIENDDGIAEKIRIGIQPQYVPLLRMGFAFAKDSRSAILILAGNTLNDDLIGVVMPIRLKEQVQPTARLETTRIERQQ